MQQVNHTGLYPVKGGTLRKFKTQQTPPHFLLYICTLRSFSIYIITSWMSLTCRKNVSMYFHSEVTSVVYYLISWPPLLSGYPTVPAKVQELAESLQQISGQLNSVLSALVSLAERQSTMPLTGFPLPSSQCHSAPAPTPAPFLPQVHTLGSNPLPTPPPVMLSEPLWNWAPQSSSAAVPLFSSPITSGLRASEDIINSRWSQIFPGTLIALFRRGF